MSGAFDFEQTDKEMAEKLDAFGMDTTQLAEMAREAEEGRKAPEYAVPSHVETCILDEDGRCDVAYHRHHYYLSRAEERRERMARKALQHETYKANVLKNAKYSWKNAQARADQLERIYKDLLSQGRIGR